MKTKEQPAERIDAGLLVAVNEAAVVVDFKGGPLVCGRTRWIKGARDLPVGTRVLVRFKGNRIAELERL